MPEKLKTLLLATALCLILAPHFTLAAVNPEDNPLCWTKSECQKTLRRGDVPEGFKIEDHFKPGGVGGECGDKEKPDTRGYCIPAGQTRAQVRIGEASVFRDLGDYIQIVYTYLVGIAGLVAAVLIIKGGFEYITSAGDATKVTSAKESIGSALIGLLLVLGSYVILNTINPELVSLKLPGVYMIRSVPIGGIWCDQIEGEDVKLALLLTGKKYGDPDLKYEDLPRFKAKCGENYLYTGGRDKICRGRGGCAQGFACGKANSSQEKDSCVESLLSMTTTGQKEEPLATFRESKLRGVCKKTSDNSIEIVGGEVFAFGALASASNITDAENPKIQHTNFTGLGGYTDQIIANKKCGEGKTFLGFYIVAEFNHTGSNDRYTIDKSGQNLLYKIFNNWRQDCGEFGGAVVVANYDLNTCDLDKIKADQLEPHLIKVIDVSKPINVRDNNDDFPDL